jgi:hypothetical protein
VGRISSSTTALMTKAPGGRRCESAPPGEEAELEDQEERPVMTKGCGGASARPYASLAADLLASRGAGRPLADETRSSMESRFGHDFSAVRVHTDERAAAMNEALNAEALTSAADIYFRHGRYDPQSSSGRRLLAHELTHVVQQAASSPSASRLHAAAATVQARGARLQRFSLNGFPPAEKAAMIAAIPVATGKVKACSKLSWYGKRDIPIALNNVRYDYVPDLRLCGWTFPTSWYIEVGKSAFGSSCCDLASTLAHEAAHTVFYTESRARKMECNCFGCSC